MNGVSVFVSRSHMARDIGNTLLKMFLPQQSLGLRLLLVIPYMVGGGVSLSSGMTVALVGLPPESSGVFDNAKDSAYIRVVQCGA